nr:MAG: internal scaffolding protein [Microvirus Sku115]
MFKSWLTEFLEGTCERTPCSCGSEIRKEKIASRDKDGYLCLKETGRLLNLDESIQSYAETCDIKQLLNAYELQYGNPIDEFLQGHIPVGEKPYMYGDTTIYPTSQIELYKNVENSRNWFDSLPVEIREQFNYNFDSFAESVHTGKIADIMDAYNDSLLTSDQLALKNNKGDDTNG